MEIADYPAYRTLGSILRYDRKLASYKIALLRALNDVVLAFPDAATGPAPVAVPLRFLAEFWLAYYWPFMNRGQPVYQAPRAFKGGVVQQDLAFRDAVAEVQDAWAAVMGDVHPSDGFFLVNEMRLSRRGRSLAPNVIEAFNLAVREIAPVIGKNPVRYAGDGQWSVFPPPVRYRNLSDGHASVPGTRPDDPCILVRHDLWAAFRDLSLWVEALCIHEWCLFLETVHQGDEAGADRGTVYRMLTDHPDNRRPLTWERNEVDLLMMEGSSFTCPWTGRALAGVGAYDLEHIIPVTVYPVNELWNLAPADRVFNRHIKRDRLPTDARLRAAEPLLAQTYACYLSSAALGRAVHEDATTRFATLSPLDEKFATSLAASVSQFVIRMRDGRGVATFA